MPQIIDEAVLKPLVNDAKRGYLSDVGKLSWDKAPDMPVEFSAAAYRFGHSMIRQKYDLNADRKNIPIFSGDEKEPVRLTGFSPVAKENNLEMAMFFGKSAQRSRPIDTNIPSALLNLPKEVVGDDEANLALRNMLRGQLTFDLPCGEKVAKYLGITPINPDSRIEDAGLSGNTPLWYYILSEAEQSGGGKLGPVGGTLVAGVLLNLMLRGNSPLFPVAFS